MNRTAHIIMKSLLPALLILPGLLASCDDASPEHLEPSITLEAATDITRTGATVSATIELNGSGRFDSFRFIYGPDESMQLSTATVTDPGEIVSATLTSLRPGTTYHYAAIGTNGSTGAVVTSAMLTFTTDPNERPALSGTKALSTGPTGLIIGFTIDDDGGDPITAAGCDMTDISSGARSRILLPGPDNKPGVRQLYIGGMTTGHTYELRPFASNASGETTGQPLQYTARDAIVLHEAGVLKTVVGNGAVPRKLAISGNMNGDDFAFLRLLLGATPLPGETAPAVTAAGADLSNVTIVEGGGPFDGSRYTEPGTISTGLFAGCELLEDILLPFTAISIERNAFSGCPCLTSLSVPASVSKVSPSDNCPALTSILVSEANTAFSSYDGILYNATATQLLWFPMGKVGAVTLSPDLTAIGQNAFQGTRFATIALPDALEEIGRGAFASSAIERIELPGQITNIPEAMAQDCTRLTVAKLGSRVNYIGSYAFSGCPLRDLYVGAELPPVMADNAFDPSAIAAGCVLHVPAGSVAYYRNHSKWSMFTKITEE